MYDQYSMWSTEGWCVIARERVGDLDVAVVFVQFVPIKPSKGSTKKPPMKVWPRELELA